MKKKPIQDRTLPRSERFELRNIYYQMLEMPPSRNKCIKSFTSCAPLRELNFWEQMPAGCGTAGCISVLDQLFSTIPTKLPHNLVLETDLSFEIIDMDWSHHRLTEYIKGYLIWLNWSYLSLWFILMYLRFVARWKQCFRSGGYSTRIYAVIHSVTNVNVLKNAWTILLN